MAIFRENRLRKRLFPGKGAQALLAPFNNLRALIDRVFILKTLLDDMLSSKRIPLASGIWTRDGRFFSAESHDPAKEPPFDIICVAAPLPTFDRCSSINLDPHPHIWSNLSILLGEGSFGGDGIVAVREENLEVAWIAFFTFSNPFESVRIVDETALVINNSNETWKFPLKEPWKIRVIRETGSS